MVVGIVAIGRNEGERLRSCLQSLVRSSVRVVYVDSNSTDGSVAIARAMGVEAILLDSHIPFTAARARNEGFKRLREIAPGLTYVQFIDGDCEMDSGWVMKAAEYLERHPEFAVVCGRLRERFPERSIYNMLCDIEWDIPAGEVYSCGGIVMMRMTAFEQVRGFRPDLIAGEEPEICVRLRALEWRIGRLSDEMAVHDAALVRFGQWWKRTLRAGYAAAQAAFLHGALPERLGVRESRSAWFWGLGLPIAVVLLVAGLGIWAAVPLILYPVQVARIGLRGKRSARENWLHALFLVLGKFPEVLGQIKFLSDRNSGRQSRLIEYK